MASSRPNRSLFAVSALVAAAIVFTGCPPLGADGDYRCDVDTDCPDNRRCDAVAHRCAAAVVAPDAGGGADACAGADYEFAVTRQLSILFVVDDSGSMQPRQAAWVNRAGDLATMLDSVTSDWRVGFTTTDVSMTGDRGALVNLGSGKSVVRSDDAGRVADLERGFDRGSGGSGDERGLEALSLAFSLPQRPLTLAGLYRRDRSLLVAVLSDEDDASTLNLDDLKSAISTPGWDDLTGYFVVGPSTGCTDGSGEAVAGTRYGQFLTRLDGTRVSICEEEQLAPLGLAITADVGRSVFVLPIEAPRRQPTSVRVVDRGVATEQKDAVSFDPGTTTASFNPPGPPIGSKVCFFF